MMWTGKIAWARPTVNGKLPVWGVIPTPPSKEALTIDVDGVERLDVEPWKRTADGTIHSYRISGLVESPDVGWHAVTAAKGAPLEEPPKAALHPEIGHLIAGLWLETAGLDHSETRPLLVGGTKLAWGASEVSYLFTGSTLHKSKLGQASYTAMATTWHDTPLVRLDILVHNADWRNVHGDWWFRGLALHLPEGWKASETALFPEAPQLAHVLPMQQGKLFRVWLWHDSLADDLDPEDLQGGEVWESINHLSWANPICRAYLPQGVPVAGGCVHEYMVPSAIFPPYTPEGTTYGGQGSSYGVEPYGDVTLALRGHTHQLERHQAMILDRLPALLLDHKGNPLDCAKYVDNGTVPWNMFVSPMARGVSSPGKANPSVSWHPSQDPFGFTKPEQPGQKWANQNGIVCPYLGALVGYAAYDRQHWMRALRATLPLAYITGDRMSVYLLMEHASTARAEFWEGEGDPYTARVGHYYKQAKDHPGVGLAIGREDAWAIQTVLAAREIAPGDWGKRFDAWLYSYAVILADAQADESGLVQAIDNGKELDKWDGKYAICQGYQEDMLAKASAGVFTHYGLWGPGGTILAQCHGIMEAHGSNPAYKVPVREMQWGQTLLPETSAALADHSQHIDEFVPSLVVTALMQYANDEDAREPLLDWLVWVLNVDSVAALGDWEPGPGHVDRMFASVRPALAWMKQQGVLG